MATEGFIRVWNTQLVTDKLDYTIICDATAIRCSAYRMHLKRHNNGMLGTCFRHTLLLSVNILCRCQRNCAEWLLCTFEIDKKNNRRRSNAIEVRLRWLAKL